MYLNPNDSQPVATNSDTQLGLLKSLGDRCWNWGMGYTNMSICIYIIYSIYMFCITLVLSMNILYIYIYDVLYYISIDILPTNMGISKKRG